MDLTGSQRVEITVGVSCDADPGLAEGLLLEIATAHPDVLDAPLPSVFFTNLGESISDFALYCLVEDPSHVFRATSDLHYAALETLRQHGLEMPYPSATYTFGPFRGDTFLRRQPLTPNRSHIGVRLDLTASSGRTRTATADEDPRTKGGISVGDIKPARDRPRIERGGAAAVDCLHRSCLLWANI